MAEQHRNRAPAATVPAKPDHAEVKYTEVIPGGFVARLKAWPKSVEPAKEDAGATAPADSERATSVPHQAE